MAISNFIPSVWSGRILAALDKSLVYGSDMVINRDYEGEISNVGDSVRINSIGDVTISDYSRDTDINSPQALADAQQVLVIDQAKYFNFAVDDVDQLQQNPKVMEEAIRRSAYGLRNTIDQFIAALYSGAAAVTGLGDDTTALVPSTNTDGTTMYDYLVNMGIALDEANVPSDGRFAILPPWLKGRMLKDARFVGYGTPENRNSLLNGLLGEAAGFNIMISNNVPNTSGAKYKVIAGHPMAWTFVQQILKTEAFRPERRFSDAVKGLSVYGAKVIRPEALVVGTFSKT